MICSSCGAPVDDSGVFPGASVLCTCGASVRVAMPEAPGSAAPYRAATAPAEAARPSSAPNACPRCDRALEVRHAEGLVVAACTRGHGVFMTHAVLQEAKGEAAASLDRGAAAQGAGEGDETPACRCPRCDEPMSRRAFAGETGAAEGAAPVIVDVCAAHGTWFDAGELRAALTARAGADRRPEQAKATLDVALALEAAREEDSMRRAVDTADDVLDTFNLLVLGRGSRRRPW